MSFTSQEFESFVPVYDTVPQKWEDAHPFLVEQLKKISNLMNIREIGWLLDEELLTGKAFIPGIAPPTNSQPQQFRQVFRKVVDVSPLVAGANAPIPHGITFDINFTLVDLWVAGTNSGTLTARNINPNDVLLDATNINITSPQAFDRAFCVIEYMLEL